MAEERNRSRTRRVRARKRKKASHGFKLFRSILIFLLVITLLFVGITFAMVYMGTGRYPVDYEDEIVTAANAEDVDPYLVLSIVKTESDFRPDVVSNDGAIGLMQILPDTAEWVANRMGETLDIDQLTDPATNLRYGTYYLAYLIGYYQNVDLAIVAYNTGFINVDSWLADGTISREADSFSNIPYNEPRNYYTRVSKALRVYRMFYADGLPTQEEQENQFGLAWGNWRDMFKWLKREF